MKLVTTIKAQRRASKRVNIYLDNAFAFSLDVEVLKKAGLQEGQALSSSQIAELEKGDLLQRCLDAALRLLSYRPRSEAEIKGRLHRSGLNDEMIAEVTNRLKEQGLIDDIAFARFWKENRESFSPRSRRLVRQELKQKGVATDIVDKIATELDDETTAYRAALKKARIWENLDYQDFRHKLAGYLARRGFSYEVIDHTVKRLWQERGKAAHLTSETT